MSDFCDNILDYGTVKILSGEGIGAVQAALGVLYLITSLLLIYFIKLQERFARRGDDNAVQSVIFPVFVNVLWINAAVNAYIGFIALSFDFDPFEKTHDKGAIWGFSLMWALQHVVVEGVAVLLMQKGLGMNGAIRTIKIVSVWGLITLFVQWASYTAVEETSFALDLFWNFVMIFFYLALWLIPQKKLYRRPAAIFYAKFWTMFRLFVVLTTFLFYIPETRIVANCFYTFGSLFPFTILEPLVLYYTFLQDSRWWQGIDIAGKAAGPEEIRSPLQGVDLNLKSAQTLAASMDNLGISPSRHRSKNVRLLNFAYISLDKSSLLGSGSFSKVYLGKYRQRKCAIKLIFTMDVTEEIISRIAAEASILSSIKHPNVVEILGVSVLPPSVCILLELCANGSLFDVIGGTGFAALGTVNDFLKHFIRGNSIIGKYSNRGLNISWTDRLFLAVGCARGISALHSLGPEVCHRDVKSYNFLVDENLNAKISDLELGFAEERKQLKSHKGATYRTNVASNSSNSNESRKRPISGLSVESSLSSGDLSVDSILDVESNKPNNLYGDDFLANWAAPEVIKDAYHSQASDIYSFGLVLWELLVGIVPFSEIKRQDDIRQKVLNDYRPEIPVCFTTPPYDSIFIPFTELIEKCLHREPLLRPSISVVLDKLESLYKRQCYDVISVTKAVDSAVEQFHASEKNRLSTQTFFRNRPNFYSQLNVSQFPLILNALQAEGQVLDLFTESGKAWCICFNDPNFTILWCTKALEETLCIPVSELVGKSLNSLSCFEYPQQEALSQSSWFFSKSKDKSEGKEKLGQFFSLLREMRTNFEKHFVLELSVRRFRAYFNEKELSEDKAIKIIGALSQYSVHAFPIAHADSDTPNIPIGFDETASDLSLSSSPPAYPAVRRYFLSYLIFNIYMSIFIRMSTSLTRLSRISQEEPSGNSLANPNVQFSPLPEQMKGDENPLIIKQNVKLASSSPALICLLFNRLKDLQISDHTVKPLAKGLFHNPSEDQT